MSIDAKIAAAKAQDYFRDVAGVQSGITLEEVEKDAQEGLWMITLGYEEEDASQPFGLQKIRRYKIFEVSDEDGEVVSMKVREID